MTKQEIKRSIINEMPGLLLEKEFALMKIYSALFKFEDRTEDNYGLTSIALKELRDEGEDN